MLVTFRLRPVCSLNCSIFQKFQIIRNLSSAPIQIKESKLTILNTGINYAETENTSTLNSNPKRPIFFLPGAFGSIEMDFKPIVSALTGKYKWISYDPPGYGRSRPPKRPFLSDKNETVHELDVKYILGLMDKLQDKYEKFNLVAWSGAALSAFIIASEHPHNQRISSLVTFGSFGYVDEGKVPGIKMMRKLGLNAIPESRRNKLLEMYGPDYLLEMWNGWCDEAVRMVSTDKYKKGGSFQGTIEKVQCPTLVMQGTKDALVSVEQAQHLNNCIKGSQLQVIENGTHNLHLRNTSDFVQRIETFVDGVQ